MIINRIKDDIIMAYVINDSCVGLVNSAKDSNLLALSLQEILQYVN